MDTFLFEKSVTLWESFPFWESVPLWKNVLFLGNCTIFVVSKKSSTLGSCTVHASPYPNKELFLVVTIFLVLKSFLRLNSKLALKNRKWIKVLKSSPDF